MGRVFDDHQHMASSVYRNCCLAWYGTALPYTVDVVKTYEFFNCPKEPLSLFAWQDIEGCDRLPRCIIGIGINLTPEFDPDTVRCFPTDDQIRASAAYASAQRQYQQAPLTRMWLDHHQADAQPGLHVLTFDQLHLFLHPED